MSKRAKISLSGTGPALTDENGRYAFRNGKHSLLFTADDHSYFITADGGAVCVKKRGNLEYTMTFDKNRPTDIDIITEYGTLSDITLTTDELNIDLSDNTLEISARYTLSSDSAPKSFRVICAILE